MKTEKKNYFSSLELKHLFCLLMLQMSFMKINSKLKKVKNLLKSFQIKVFILLLFKYFLSVSNLNSYIQMFIFVL